MKTMLYWNHREREDTAMGSPEQNNLRIIFKALQEKGYRPIEQIVGFIITEDPTYITNHNDARKLAARIDRHELLRDIVQHYFS